jgi:hypothetical protein
LDNIAIVTMVYNEHVNLPIWIRHYTSHCPGAALFVVDHGSDDGSTSKLRGTNVIPLPRTPFDDGARAEAMSDLQHALLKFYDVVVYTDCDEMLVADLTRHGSLVAFLEECRQDVIAPVGLTVRRVAATDPPLNLSRPILAQPRHVEFAIGSRKPTIVLVPTRWAPGFHWCHQMPAHRLDLYLFHLNAMEIEIMLQRLQITSAMQWSERATIFGWSAHQQETNLDRRRRYEVATSRFSALSAPVHL